MMIRGTLKRIAQTASRLMQIDSDGREGERFYKRELAQMHGFASMPYSGSRSLILKNGMVVVCIAAEDPAKRPDLSQAGEGAAALYSNADTWVKVMADGTVEIKCTKLKVNGTHLEVT